MTIHIVVHNVAAFLAAHAVGERPDPGNVRTREKTHAILVRQSLPTLNFLLDIQNIQIIAVQSIRLLKYAVEQFRRPS